MAGSAPIDLRRVSFRVPKENTDPGVYETITGLFHQWGMTVEALNGENYLVTVAIIEDESGRVHEVPPTLVKFLQEKMSF